ncbi:restriction endonuclease subunit S [Bradyrhizobium sp. LLZ17]|uniref:Restriction endonuclease subunit S n=1 Tax=Bradyrhizobium sp. LLZ17 TaxID=3239388 RepID=A0AB39XIX1_9BRAD
MKAGYKQTEAGIIPNEWEVEKLGNFISLQRGHDLTWRDRRSGEIPVMGSAGQNGCHDTAIAKGPGVVLGRSGASFGQAHYCEHEFWPHNTALYVTDFRGNDPLFVFYFLKAIDFSRHNSGGAQQSLNRNFIAPILIGVPRPPEQRAIAEALSDVDALVGALDRLIAKKRDLKQVAMQQLLTGEIRLPGFHGEWQVKRLGSLLRFQVGFPFVSTYFNEKAEGIRLIKNRDLKSDDQVVHYDGSYDHSFVVHNGDVLIGMDGDFLPCRWSKGPALLNQRVGRIFPSPGLNGVFAYYALIEPLKKIETITSSTTVKHLSHGDVEGIECPIPDLPEQTAIAEVLREMDEELTSLEQRRKKPALSSGG